MTRTRTEARAGPLDGKDGNTMKMANAKGEAVYYNIVEKNGKLQYVVKGIGDTVVLGRHRQKRKSLIFTQEAQAERFLDRNGFRTAY